MRATAHERFAQRLVRMPNGCWILRGTLQSAGYSVIRDSGTLWYGHRWSWTQAFGPIPEGLDLDHLCRNRPCVNPQHLEPVTRQVNVDRGDGRTQGNCKSGHAMTPTNSYFAPKSGKRQCRRCNADRQWLRRRRLGQVKSADIDAWAIDLSA